MPFVPNPNPAPKPCQDPNHFPPNMMVWPPGTDGWWVCPACGARSRIFVQQITC